MKKIKAAVIAAATAVIFMGLTSSCGSRDESAVIIAGSTSVQPYVEVLVETYEILYRDYKVDVQGGGSSAGVQAVGSGTADIGMSSRPLKDAERELWSAEIARDGLAVIIHPKNPVKNLSLEEVRDIYTGKIDNWNYFDGGADAKIHIISREEGSGTRSAFEELAMDGERVNPRAIVQNSNGAVKQLVSNDKNSIGYVSLGLINDTVEAIMLDGTAATWENVMNGSYSLFRPFIFVAEAEPEGAAKQFVDFILSPDGQRILTEEGLIPVITATTTTETDIE